MKRIIGIAMFLVFGIGVFAQNSRTALLFNEIKWKLYSGVESNNLADMLANANALQLTINPLQIVIGEFDFDSNSANMVALYHYGSTTQYNFNVNGSEIKNELKGNSFFADISPFVIDGKNYIVLKCNKIQTVDEFNSSISTTQFAFLNGLVFTKFEVMKDAYFGGNMIEVTVHNFNPTDLDGKIYGKLYSPESLDLIAENTNCAFTRAGQDLTIEINFIDLKKDMAGQKTIVELTIVDKENNEEVVEMLTLPVIF
jgi:hypothetical protein